MNRIPFYLILGLGIHSGFSQSQLPADTSDITIEQLLQLKAETEASELQKMLNEHVAASSRKQLSSRETPGIVSIVTAEEISRSGARDLVDVLRVIPGFDFAMDVDFVDGIGLRGNWANEGKVLVLVDGNEYNELLYQTVPFGNKFPIDHIQRIEIIRGPGSSVYGGTAEYGVINIITKGGGGVESLEINTALGMLPQTPGRLNTSLSFGKKIHDKWYVDGTYYQGSSIKSDQWYQDLYTEQAAVDLKDFSLSEARNLNVGLAYQKAKVRYILDQYSQQGPEFEINYRHMYLSAKNDFNVGKKLIFTPSFNYSSQQPWSRVTFTDSADIQDYQVRAQRVKAGLSASYDISRKVNLIAGTEYFRDRAFSLLDDDNFGEGVSQIVYHNMAFFGQGLLKHPWANITLGFRYDKHNAFRAAFVPRLALTKRINQFHFKALMSRAYRAPGIENINLNDSIRPEVSNVAELELGYQFTADMLLVVNAFKINTKDVIIYSYTDLENGEYLESYSNYERIGTQGIEVIYKIKQSRWHAHVAYSFYRANAGHTVDTYRVVDEEQLLVAFPAHKVGINGSTQVLKNLWLSTSLLYGSKRYAYSTIDTESVPVLNRFDPYTQMNLYFSYDHFLLTGLQLGAGVFDLFNVKTPVLQAYNGDYAPVPGRSREIMLKLSYQLSFEK